jgi:peptide/nickel transport system substrate-binding protein
MKKRISILLAVILVMSMLVTGCGSNTSEDGTSASGEASATETASGEKTVTVAMPSAWSDLFPMGESNYYDRIIFDQVYDTLVKQNADGTYVGDLAESWEVNDESTQITFKLREGIKWHDGEAFSAQDIVDSMKMYSDPEVNASSRYYLEFIAGCDDSGAENSEDSLEVAANGDNEVVITLKEATFIDTVLDDLSKVFIVASHKINGLTAEEINKASTWSEPMGTGAFIYADAIDGERMEFTANKDYFRGTPDMDKLVVRVVESSNLLAGLMNGEVDTVLYGGVPLDDWSMAKEQDNLTCVSSETTGYQMVIFNASKDYMTQEVREALSMAIDRQTLVDQLLQGEGQTIVTPISPISPYYDENTEVWYDQDKAKEMLEEANFPFDQTLSFVVPTGNTIREKAATMIAEDLKKIGVQVEIEQADFATVMDKLKNGESDLGIVGSGGTMNPSESLEMLTGSFNLAHLPDDNELAALLTKANNLLSFEERQPVFQEFQEKMKEISPYAYLFTTNNLVAFNNRLSEVNVDNFGTFNFEIYTWKVSE